MVVATIFTFSTTLLSANPTAEAVFSRLMPSRYILIVISERLANLGKYFGGLPFYVYFTNNFAIHLAEILHHSGNFAWQLNAGQI